MKNFIILTLSALISSLSYATLGEYRCMGYLLIYKSYNDCPSFVGQSITTGAIGSYYLKTGAGSSVEKAKEQLLSQITCNTALYFSEMDLAVEHERLKIFLKTNKVPLLPQGFTPTTEDETEVYCKKVEAL